MLFSSSSARIRCEQQHPSVSFVVYYLACSALSFLSETRTLLHFIRFVVIVEVEKRRHDLGRDERAAPEYLHNSLGFTSSDTHR